MSPEHEQQYRAHLEYFCRDAHVVAQGQRCAFTEEDLQVERSLEWTANDMAFHDGGSPDENHPYPPSEA